MGTGMVSILLNILPYQNVGLYRLSVVFYCLNIAIFGVTLGIYVCRNVLWPEILPIMIRDPVISLFIATIPIGFATLIDMFVLVCVPIWGDWAKQMAWGMWWIDVVFGVMSCFCLPFVM